MTLTLEPDEELSLSAKRILYILTFVFGVSAAPLRTTLDPVMPAVKLKSSLLPEK